MNLKNAFNRLKRVLSLISLADYFLLAFMVILMWQSAHNLFFHEFCGEFSAIDIVIRTSAVGIFGYFIGNGFSQAKGLNKEEPNKTATAVSQTMLTEPKAADNTPVSRIGFSAAADTQTQFEIGNAEPIDINTPATEKSSHQQTVIVGLIGIVSLLLLVVARNSGALSPEATATLSQLRDFVAASTGFLIGDINHSQAS